MSPTLTVPPVTKINSSKTNFLVFNIYVPQNDLSKNIVGGAQKELAIALTVTIRGGQAHIIQNEVVSTPRIVLARNGLLFIEDQILIRNCFEATQIIIIGATLWRMNQGHRT